MPRDRRVPSTSQMNPDFGVPYFSRRVGCWFMRSWSTPSGPADSDADGVEPDCARARTLSSFARADDAECENQ